MKNIYKNIIVACLFGTLWACSNPLDEKVDFGVDVEATHKVDGNITVKRGEPLAFKIVGDPNFITFYSGEAGSEYAKREQTESSKEDINSSLKFTLYGDYGIPEGSLSVYLSKTFSGLTKDFEVDRENIANHEWIDITEACNIPTKTGKNNGSDVEISLEEYLDGEMTIAVHYHPTYTGTSAQTKWIFKDFRIENVDKKSGEIADFGVSNMGFTPVYITLPEEVTDHYEFNTSGRNKSGMWNFSKLVDKGVFDVHSSGSKVPFAQDSWLISKSLKTNARIPDKGLAIKNLQIYMDEYVHTYNKVGTYDVTFIATNSNYKHTSRIVKHLKVLVTD